MSYKEFLENIDKYVGKIVRFTTKRKMDGYVSSTERYVWDNKEFGELKPDAPMEILNVEIVRNGKINKNIPGIIGVR